MNAVLTIIADSGRAIIEIGLSVGQNHEFIPTKP
jgi:hypothetical protein